MARSVTCPRCGIRTQSKFMTDPNKRPRHVGELRFCPVCGVRLQLLRGVNGRVKGVAFIDD